MLSFEHRQTQASSMDGGELFDFGFVRFCFSTTVLYSMLIVRTQANKGFSRMCSLIARRRAYAA